MAKRILLIAVLAISLLERSLTQDIWEPLNFPDTTRIMSITNNKQGYIYVGVLWGNFSNGGVYRSVDSGNNWEFCGLYEKTISSLTIDKAGNIYAGTSNEYWMPGLFRSDDNGQSWDTIIINPNYAGNIVEIFTVGMDTIFLSMWGNTGQLLRSTDNGLLWDLIYDSGDVAEYITDIEIDNNGDLYVCMAAYWINFGGVYRSSDWGDTWEFIGLLNYTMRALEFNQYGDLFAGAGSGLFVLYQGDDEWTCLLGLNTKDIIINNDGVLFVLSDDYNGIIRSDDYGQSFEYFNSGIVEPWIGDVAMDSSGYLIASKYSSHLLYRTVNSTLITNIPSMADDHSSGNISVFPNPVSNFLMAEIADLKSLDIKIQVIVYNISGKVINCYYGLLYNENLQINVSNLSPGFYYIKINLNKKTYYSKFIKK